MKTFGQLPPIEQVSFELPIAEFYDSFLKIVSSNREQRMALAGMIELRVDMIVVGVCLIDFVLKRYDIRQIKVSNFALKEGVLSKQLSLN